MRSIFCATILLLLTLLTFDSNANSKPNESNYLMVVKNYSVVFNIADEGIEFKKCEILEQPAFGTLTLNKDNTFSYIPNKNVCEEIDAFTYTYEVGGKVEKLTVYVEILCESLTIINGFTTKEEQDPNSFTIIGAENYPNNTLYIFNDKGNQIFYEEGYVNTWNGRNDGQMLDEELTYFYVFNDGVGNTYSGYIQIN